MAALTRFTPAVVEAILQAKRSRESDRAAATAGGVTPSALYGWLRRGRRGDPRFADFVNAFESAERAAIAVRDDALRAACRAVLETSA